jgi:hypothetical protein
MVFSRFKAKAAASVLNSFVRTRRPVLFFPIVSSPYIVFLAYLPVRQMGLGPGGYNNWQALDEEDAASRDRQVEMTDELHRKLTHPTWQSVFLSKGKIGETQRKQLMTMIKNSPREYRTSKVDAFFIAI